MSEKWSNLPAWFGAALITFMTGIPDLVLFLLLAMAIDIIIASFAAAIEGKLSPSVAWKGIGKKAVALLLVTLVYKFSSLVTMGDSSFPMGQTITGFYIYGELLSIVGNAIRAGVPVPEFMLKAFAGQFPAQKTIQKVEV